MRDIQFFGDKNMYTNVLLYGTDLSLVLDTITKIFKHGNITFERQSWMIYKHSIEQILCIFFDEENFRRLFLFLNLIVLY